MPHDAKLSASPLSAPPVLNVGEHALFLDLDGTLVEIAAHPENVIASDEVRALLAELTRAMNGAIALITGRSIASADAVLDGVLMNIAGIHGLERRAGGVAAAAAHDASAVVAAAAQAREMIRVGALDADVEEKGPAFALHYRRNPQAAGMVRRAAAEIAERHGLSVIEGKMVVELKLGERNKGDAVRDFMAAGPFAGRTPVAIGDDVTDEDAFAAVNQLGGVSVLVGAPRATAARHGLDCTKAVFEWLRTGLPR